MTIKQKICLICEKPYDRIEEFKLKGECMIRYYHSDKECSAVLTEPVKIVKSAN